MLFGVKMPGCIFCLDIGPEKSAIPCLRFWFLLALKEKVVVVGVAGGEEGLACWAKLKFGVEGRMAIIFEYSS